MQISQSESTNRNSKRQPPLVRGLPIVGELPGLLSKQLDHLSTLHERHGDIFTIDLGFTRMVMLNHPSHAQHVLRDRARAYGKESPLWIAVRGLIGNGLPTSDGDYWLRQRRMMQPHFHRERLAAMTALMVEAIDEELASWDALAAAGQPVDLFPLMTRMTMRVIVKTMFGSQLDVAQADVVGREMGYALDYMLRGMVTERLPRWVPVPGRARFHEAVRKIDAVLFDIIARKKRSAGQGGGELISMLLDTVDVETNQRMTDKELRDEAMAIFLAGYETTSASMSFGFHHLIQNAEVLRKLLAELDGRLGTGSPAFADLPHLPYSMMVVKEALRLSPPAFWIPRSVKEDDEIDGYELRKGQEIGVMTYLIHRHPQFFSDPDRFDPNRWEAAAVEQRHPMSWIPFGGGKRLCIGKEFALIEGQLILARVLSRFALTPIPGRTATVHVGATLRPGGGVWVRLARR